VDFEPKVSVNIALLEKLTELTNQLRSDLSSERSKTETCRNQLATFNLPALRSEEACLSKEIRALETSVERHRAASCRRLVVLGEIQAVGRVSEELEASLTNFGVLSDRVVVLEQLLELLRFGFDLSTRKSK